MVKIIMVCGNKNAGSCYMRELIRAKGLTDVKYSSFGFACSEIGAKGFPKEAPFIVIPEQWNKHHLETKSVIKASQELWVRGHMEIQESQVKNHL